MKDSKPQPRIRVRQARPSDRKTVFKFCQKTWSWGDYIQHFWDSWLKDKNGRIFVATINAIPIGMAQVSIDKPREVWLRAARTDPSYRRMGIQTVIAEKCLQYAKKRGAEIARLVTSSDNVAAQGLLKRLEFRPVAEFIETETKRIVEEGSENSRWAGEGDSGKLWDYVQKSKIYCKSAGLYTVLFHWFSLERPDLERLVGQRKAILHLGRAGQIDGLILIDDSTAREWHKDTLQTCYVDGDYDAVVDMTRFLGNFCHVSGIKKIYGFACKDEPTVTALKTVGFESPESTEIVYAKKMK